MMMPGENAPKRLYVCARYSVTMLLSCSHAALSWGQMAVNAARADLAARGARALTSTLPGGDCVERLRAPATPARVKAAIGNFNISELLRAAA